MQLKSESEILNIYPLKYLLITHKLPGGTSGKESAVNAEDPRETGSVPGLGRFPGAGNGNYSSICAWKISMDRGAWRATVHGATESNTTE